MKFKSLDHFFTGVAVPVSALKSKESCGIGEFLDLVPLGDWCKSANIEVIQILPVNDTGFQSSPYSALSAFALHPIYLRIQSLPEFSSESMFQEKLEKIRTSYNQKEKIDFYNLLKAKLELLSIMYKKTISTLQADQALQMWIRENPWVKVYAVFSLLKEQHGFSHWNTWPGWQEPETAAIDVFWNEHLTACTFYAWLQFHLEQQLCTASRYLEENGICLKGDIPILMNEDSVDLWIDRKFFDIRMHAGAPPDMFSEEGQNWGFPVYNWDQLEAEGYYWWTQRLKQADKFYHAYRIDHVLGFFRIWQIPATDITGILGYFNPAKYISAKDLLVLGYDKGRVRWLSQPHIHRWDLNNLDPLNVQRLKNKYLAQIGNEDLYNLEANIRGEQDIHSLPENQQVKDFLRTWYRNRTLIEVKKDYYHRLWNYPDTKAFKSLNFDEKIKLDNLFKEAERKSETIWSKQGFKLLSMMQAITGMLMCAEDLGVVPACVPKVLQKLNILSLKIERWTREYTLSGHPYIPVSSYPRLSVCTPSVHDTTTLRGWWEEELTDHQRKEYFELICTNGTCPDTYTRTLARQIIQHNLQANSILAVFQLQDFLFLNEQLSDDVFLEDRINVPGIVSEENWAYRMPLDLEELRAAADFNAMLSGMILSRKKRKATI